MSDFITFEVKGLKEMGDKLAQLPGKIARRALAAATLQGANVIRTAAREAAPTGTKTYKDWRGKTHRPGTLKKFGVVSKKLRPRDWQTTALYGVGFSKRAFYGRWIERGKDKKHHQAARPFVVPRLEEKRDEIVQAIKSRLGEEILRIVAATPGLSIK